MNETLHIRYDGEQLELWEENCYENRGKSTASLVKQAFQEMSSEKKASLNPFDCFFYLGDKSHYPFSYGSSAKSNRTIPCFAFDCWKECGIEDYQSTCADIEQRGKQKPIHDCLFWIGNINTHPTRRTLISMSSVNRNMCCYDSGNWHGQDGALKHTDKKYISIPDHAEYKYLIDLQGNGFSARTKMLMHSGRPLFYQDRQWHEYWFFDMQPFVHFIPVSEDLSDLEVRLQWAIDNPDVCERIAENALIFAKANLRRESAVQRFQDILMLLGGM